MADNIQYAKAVKFTGTRENAAALDFSGILEEVRTHVWGRACVGEGRDERRDPLIFVRGSLQQFMQIRVRKVNRSPLLDGS